MRAEIKTGFLKPKEKSWIMVLVSLEQQKAPLNLFLPVKNALQHNLEYSSACWFYSWQGVPNTKSPLPTGTPSRRLCLWKNLDRLAAFPVQGKRDRESQLSEQCASSILWRHELTWKGKADSGKKIHNTARNQFSLEWSDWDHSLEHYLYFHISVLQKMWIQENLLPFL